MVRSSHPGGDPPDPPPGDGQLEWDEEHRDGTWRVRRVPGGRAGKDYRCPGCDHQVRAGTPHLLVWPVLGLSTGWDGIDDRRHWHTPCWRARGRR